MIPSVTETWTVIDPSGKVIWSSGPQDETPIAADHVARASGGTVLRALYSLVSVEKEASYAPFPAVLERRNEIRRALTRWEVAADGPSGDAEREAAHDMADILHRLLAGEGELT
jgi:hypothetical protein